ncbi:ESX-1 secretion-associated protein [Mycobacterium gallinarum]|uniref:ESX-1 secretion-associated protein n=1 Tax=Mycobacterium gallinarum TaxID=39689 RepID=A0A9W4B6E3_9MYCO|nr:MULTISPECIES: ESX-1 secretion-associated protein [Mycobacterium]MDV3131475.1 ESX-1 secretion-associated protein [Mycobacterium sp. 29Ha]BBY94717.1 ESX-1 secretion-associated protein [Mycobacterium gallinarum]
MSGDDVRVTTAHLDELAGRQVRAAAETRSAAILVDGVDAAVRSTHGVIASATAGAVSDIVAARRAAGMKIAAISDDLGHKLHEAARRYDHADDAMGRVLDGQVEPR